MSCVLRGVSKLTLVVKRIFKCTSVAETDRGSSQTLVINGSQSTVKRILEESLASITPYFRQASMKRAARSKCLMLQEEKDRQKFCQKPASAQS